MSDFTTVEMNGTCNACGTPRVLACLVSANGIQLADLPGSGVSVIQRGKGGGTISGHCQKCGERVTAFVPFTPR